MEEITIIFVFLIGGAVSSMIAQVVNARIPLPFIQIAIGALIAQLFSFRIDLDPDIFLVLFIAPLLFLDGWRIPKEDLRRDKWTIVALAFGLVIFTVIGAGWFIHWLIPAIPLPIAFALAALLSPTDAVAVSAIAARAPIPRRLMHILEGEALLNDASGLVCQRFAIAAAVTGSFSLLEASLSFVWLALGGLAVGAGVTLLANAAKDRISKRFGEETGAVILISLLIPFGAYLLAEHVAASGILAAVAAGVVMSAEEMSGRAMAVTRIRRAAVWDAVQFVGNGLIFILLGQQLPDIAVGAGRVILETGREAVLWLLAYVLAISCVLGALRFLWVWITFGAVLFRREGGRAIVPGWRLIAVTSLAGVRGALALSGAMTLPLTLQAGAAFPTRELAIFLAAGTIVVSLVTAHLALPALLKGVKLPPETRLKHEEDAARLATAQAAIGAMEQTLRTTGLNGKDADLRMAAATRIMADYRQRIDDLRTASHDIELADRVDRIERRLRVAALCAEREELYRIARSGRLTEELAHALTREVDLQESRFSVR